MVYANIKPVLSRFNGNKHIEIRNIEERKTMTEKLHGIKPAMICSPLSQGDAHGWRWQEGASYSQ